MNPIPADPLIREKDALHTASRAACMHARERMLIHAKGPVDRGKDLGLWFPIGVRTFARHVRDLLDRVEQKNGRPIPADIRAAIDEQIGHENAVHIQVPESELLPMLWVLAASYLGTDGARFFRYRDGMIPKDPRQFRPGQTAELPPKQPEERAEEQPAT